MSRINWTQVLVFGLVALVVFLVGISLLPMLFGGGYWGMGPGMMGRGGMPALSPAEGTCPEPVERMGGWCPWCGKTGQFGSGRLLGGLFGLLFTLLGLLIPIGLLGLLILGGVWLVRSISSPTAVVRPSPTCSHCGQPVQADWQHCPYCGEEL